MTPRRPKVFAIVPAAGAGTRLGSGTKKQFLPLKGKPVIVHTLHVFEHCTDVDEIAVAVPESALVDMETLISRHRLHKVSKVIAGGERRQDSVFHVLRKLNAKDSDIIVVHDGVRPFVEARKITQAIEACKEHGAAILAVQPKDTVRTSKGDGYFDSTLDRSALWLVQTPQVFTAAVLRKAFDKANSELLFATDEAALVEHIGIRSRIVEGSYDNIKITTPEDLELAGLIYERLHASR